MSVSAFFTAYSASRNGEHVEAIAVIVDDADPTSRPRFVIVDEHGAASIARADELDLYGAFAQDGGSSDS